MIRETVLKLQSLGRLSGKVMDEFINFLDEITPPINYKEAEILVKLFPDTNGCGVD